MQGFPAGVKGHKDSAKEPLEKPAEGLGNQDLESLLPECATWLEMVERSLTTSSLPVRQRLMITQSQGRTIRGRQDKGH